MTDLIVRLSTDLVAILAEGVLCSLHLRPAATNGAQLSTQHIVDEELNS
jgi:hypothetical protein